MVVYTENGVKSCEIQLSALSELTVTSSTTSSSSSSVAAAGAQRFSVNTTVYVACRNSSLLLSGSAQLTCQPNGSWDHSLPTCQRESVVGFSTDKDQQQSRAVAQKAHDAVTKFDTYRNLQRHRAVLHFDSTPSVYIADRTAMR